jgi:hypothetical protein
VESCGGGQIWEHVGRLMHCSSYKSVGSKLVEEYSVRVGVFSSHTRLVLEDGS